MKEQYLKNEFGIIYQKNPKIIDYNIEYVEKRYNTYGESVERMSHLRLGYIIGSIGNIPESILDVGYGNGNFLKTCSKIIKNTYGNDISGYPIPEDSIFIENIFEKYFEIITFFDCLEHYSDINFLKNLNCKYICISVPWCHYFDENWFENWKHRRPNEHLWHFNEKSLECFMKSQNFKLINHCNIEDTIRKDSTEHNILTSIFIKNN